MKEEEWKQQIVDAIASGKMNGSPTIIFGDQVTHKVANVESGGIGIQINTGSPFGEGEQSLYPHKNKYTEVLEWLTVQKTKGVDFYAAAGNNRSKMCRKLSEIFGWEVDENSLRKAETEAEKHKK